MHLTSVLIRGVNFGGSGLIRERLLYISIIILTNQLQYKGQGYMCLNDTVRVKVRVICVLTTLRVKVRVMCVLATL